MKTSTLSDETAQLILNNDMDIYDILTCREGRIKGGEDVLIQDMYDETAADNGLHPDDDFEEIIEIMMGNIAADFG
jgi:hypothetical protein